MALVGLSRPKAVHGLEIVGQGIEISKYDALKSAYMDVYDMHTSRSAYDVHASSSAYFQLVGHGHPKKVAISSTSKVSQHLPRLDQGNSVTFEALATPVELLERGGCVLMDTTQRKVSPESHRSLAWGKSTGHENGMRSEVNESVDITQMTANNEVETMLISSSFYDKVSSAKSFILDEFSEGLKVKNTKRETVSGESEDLQLHNYRLDDKHQTKITKSDFQGNKLIPIWNQSFADPAWRQKNQSVTFRGSAVQKSPWSTFHCRSVAAESFNDIIVQMSTSFPARHSRHPQHPRPLSSLIPSSKNQRSQHFLTQRGTYSLPWQSSSCHNTLTVVGHSKNTPKVNTFSAETSESPHKTNKQIESVVLGPRSAKFSSRTKEKFTLKTERKIEAFSGDWLNKWFIGGTRNELCNNCLAGSGVVTNGYTPVKGFTPKSKPIIASPVKSSTSSSYSALRNSQSRLQNSESAHYDQNGGRMAPRSGRERQGSRAPSRSSLEKSNAANDRNLSEAKVMQSSNSDSVQTSSTGNQVCYDISVNRAIGSPISLKLNGLWNPDENRTKVLTAHNTNVENGRNQMQNLTVTMESSEKSIENSRTSLEKSKTLTDPVRNSTAPVANSTATAEYSATTVENLDISDTTNENSKVSCINKVTLCLSPTSRSISTTTPRPPSRSSRLHSIQSPEPVLSGSTDLSGDLTCNNFSSNNENPAAETKKCSDQLNGADFQRNGSITLTDEKDGCYFLRLVAQVESELKKNCAELEQFLQGSIPDEASGKVRAATGKANLLMTKKFKQFRELCNNNLTQSHEDQFQTTSEDLTGYWDLVLLQVDEIQRLFHDIRTLQSNNWIDSELQNAFAPLSPSRTEVWPKEQTTQSTKKPRSSKVSGSSKAREESRKRLMAAKLAGRQRKSSETEEEIQIFIS